MVKLPGGVGVYKILGKMGKLHRPIIRTVATSVIAPEGAFCNLGYDRGPSIYNNNATPWPTYMIIHSEYGDAKEAWD